MAVLMRPASQSSVFHKVLLSLLCCLHWCPCDGKPKRGRKPSHSSAEARRCNCVEWQSDAMLTYDQRDKFFIYDAELSAEGSGPVYQAHFNDNYGYQRRMNLFLYSSGEGGGWFVGNDLHTANAATAYAIDSAGQPDLVTSDWNVLRAAGNGKATWDVDRSVVATCIEERICRGKKMEHKAMMEEETTPSDACDHIVYYNDEKVNCLRKVIKATPPGMVRTAYQSKLAFVFRRTFNPSSPDNEERMQECVHLWHDVIKLMPDNAEPYTKLGEAQVMTNQLAESEVTLRKAISLRPPTNVRHEAYESMVKALQWMGRPQEAMFWQSSGTQLGIFAAADQRPATFIDSVPRWPVWADFETQPTVDTWKDYPCLVKAFDLFQEYFDDMVKEFSEWREEKPEGGEESHKDRFAFHDPQFGGWWEYFVWPIDPFGVFNSTDKYAKEHPAKDRDVCNQRAPKLCEMVKKLGMLDDPEHPPSDPENLQILNARYSIIGPNAHIRPHCGPANTKLTIHLPLIVPQNGSRWRVANHTSPMVERKPLIFDDSFEHEVWNDGDTARVTLWIFFVHPALNSCGAHAHQSRTTRMLRDWSPEVNETKAALAAASNIFKTAEGAAKGAEKAKKAAAEVEDQLLGI
eukprot:CAMPEP_0178443546 /NCGR_PEP_ID=MMETSP0689_2-20121128/38962_1 /TAXON_ID=160604 /ORGANISM="Amphidinium massartii, Strain CS-259" /LENGTH=630 /DNA_ID=CAMNT_0020067579 /DNA_START=82 /DNA_END=1973 /DNA_ORIENTATION=+